MEQELSERLEAMGERLERIERLAQLGTWELDLIAGRLTWSSEIFRIFDRDPASFQPSYQAFLDTIHPADRERVNQAYQDSLQTRQPYAITHRLRMPDGRIKYVHEQCETRFDEQGRALLSRGSVQDITEQYLVRQALAMLATTLVPLSGEAFYQAICRYICEALELDIAFIGRLQEDGCGVDACAGWADGAALTRFSYQLAGTPCENVMELGHAIYPRAIQPLFPGDQMLVEMGIESYIGSALHDKEQHPLGIIVALGRRSLCQAELAKQLLDIFVDSAGSELLREQAAARTQFQISFQGIVAEASAALTAATEEETFDAVVNGLLRQLGELFGMDRCYLFSLSPDLSRMSNTHEWCAAGITAHMAQLQGCLVERMPWYREHMWEVIHLPDVAALPEEAALEREEFTRQGIRSLLLLPMISSHGALLGFFGFDAVRHQHRWSDEQIVTLRILTDVLAGAIARRRVEAALAQSNAELEQFAYAASHDLRQPLRMVNSYMGLLECTLADKLDEETREMMHFASDGAKRMDQMLVSLLEYSRVGRMGEPMRPLQSRQVLDEALHFLQPAIEEAAAQVEVCGEWPELLASRDELSRLWQNLISNALKFRVPDRPVQVTLSAEAHPEGWCFCVTDNGIGVGANQVDRLFKVFQRLHTRQQYEGTGIGLALARKIVERHGGRIWLESEGEGKGSRFCFVLPVATQDSRTGEG